MGLALKRLSEAAERLEKEHSVPSIRNMLLRFTEVDLFLSAPRIEIFALLHVDGRVKLTRSDIQESLPHIRKRALNDAIKDLYEAGLVGELSVGDDRFILLCENLKRAL